MTSRRRTSASRRPAELLAAAALLGGLGFAAVSQAGAPPTKTEAKAFAVAVNLRTGDLPGFKTGAIQKTTAADQKSAAQLAHCSGGVAPSLDLLDVVSPDFTADAGGIRQDVSSDVETLPTAALVAQDLASIRSTRGKRCLEKGFEASFEATKVANVTFSHPSLQSASIPAVGASGSFALRFTITATVHGEKIPYYADFLGFTLGPVEVTLQALAFAEPVSSHDELGLLAVLLRRAEAATLPGAAS